MVYGAHSRQICDWLQADVAWRALQLRCRKPSAATPPTALESGTRASVDSFTSSPVTASLTILLLVTEFAARSSLSTPPLGSREEVTELVPRSSFTTPPSAIFDEVTAF